MFWFIPVLNTHKRRDAKRETCTYMNAKRGTHTTNGPDACLVVCDASPLEFDFSNKAEAVKDLDVAVVQTQPDQIERSLDRRPRWCDVDVESDSDGW